MICQILKAEHLKLLCPSFAATTEDLILIWGRVAVRRQRLILRYLRSYEYNSTTSSHSKELQLLSCLHCQIRKRKIQKNSEKLKRHN